MRVGEDGLRVYKLRGSLYGGRNKMFGIGRGEGVLQTFVPLAAFQGHLAPPRREQLSECSSRAGGAGGPSAARQCREGTHLRQGWALVRGNPLQRAFATSPQSSLSSQSGACGRCISSNPGPQQEPARQDGSQSAKLGDNSVILPVLVPSSTRLIPMKASNSLFYKKIGFHR